MKEQTDRANDFIDFAVKSPTKYHYKQYKIKTTGNTISFLCLSTTNGEFLQVENIL